MGVGDNEGQSEPDGYGESSDGDGLPIGGDTESLGLGEELGEGEGLGPTDADGMAVTLADALTAADGAGDGDGDVELVVVQPITTLSSTRKTPQRPP